MFLNLNEVFIKYFPLNLTQNPPFYANLVFNFHTNCLEILSQANFFAQHLPKLELNSKTFQIEKEEDFEIQFSFAFVFIYANKKLGEKVI